MDSCFALIGARQHCVARICNASQRANAHKLQNDPFHIKLRTLNSPAPRNTRCHITCFRAQGDKVLLFLGWSGLLQILRWQRFSYAALAVSHSSNNSGVYLDFVTKRVSPANRKKMSK